MRQLWKKDNDFLVTDIDQSPPPDYSSCDELPPAGDAWQYTYHWQRGDGLHTIERFRALQLTAPFYPVNHPGPEPTITHPHKPPNKPRRALQARLRRLCAREREYAQRLSLFMETDHKRLYAIRRKIKTLTRRLNRAE